MKFSTSTLFSLFTTAVVAAPALAAVSFRTVLNYDTLYDNAKAPFSATACSADFGPLHGFKTFGELPSYPRIAGSFVVEGFNSTNCGTCYHLSYTGPDGKGNSLPFIVVNSAPRGFISSLESLTELTGLERNQVTGDIQITATQATPFDCGLSTTDV